MTAESRRFIRNEEATQSLQREMFAYRNTPENSPLGRVLKQHFILDDTETGETLHLIAPYSESGGLALVDESLEQLSSRARSDRIRAVFFDLAKAWGRPVRYYDSAQVFEIDPNNGRVTRVST